MKWKLKEFAICNLGCFDQEQRISFLTINNDNNQKSNKPNKLKVQHLINLIGSISSGKTQLLNGLISILKFNQLKTQNQTVDYFFDEINNLSKKAYLALIFSDGKNQLIQQLVFKVKESRLEQNGFISLEEKQSWLTERIFIKSTDEQQIQLIFDSSKQQKKISFLSNPSFIQLMNLKKDENSFNFATMNDTNFDSYFLQPNNLINENELFNLLSSYQINFELNSIKINPWLNLYETIINKIINLSDYDSQSKQLSEISDLMTKIAKIFDPKIEYIYFNLSSISYPYLPMNQSKTGFFVKYNNQKNTKDFFSLSKTVIELIYLLLSLNFSKTSLTNQFIFLDDLDQKYDLKVINKIITFIKKNNQFKNSIIVFSTKILIPEKILKSDSYFFINNSHSIIKIDNIEDKKIIKQVNERNDFNFEFLKQDFKS